METAFVYMAYAFLLGACGILVAGFFTCGYKILKDMWRED